MSPRKIIAIAAFLLTMGVTESFALAPQLLNYQGRLTDSTGSTITDTVDLTITIYDSLTGGSSIWTETQTGIAVDDGIFNVLVGSVSTLMDTVFNDTSRYLGIAVNADPELSPRARISAVAFAMRVNSVDKANGGDIDGDVSVSDKLSTLDFQMSNGADSALYLQSYDTLGNAQWASLPSPGGGNTLDGAYDEGGGGDGRRILADSGAVDIVGYVNNDAVVVRDTAGAGVNNKELIKLTHNGPGHAIEIIRSSSGTGIVTTHNGTGPGGFFDLKDSTNAKNSLEGKTIGKGFGVKGEAGIDGATLTLPRAGVGGYSGIILAANDSAKERRGVTGASGSSDGVWGMSRRSGTYAASAGPSDIRAGVLGTTVPGVGGSADNFGAAGIPDDAYSGTGVLGIGSGERGHGMIGISGNKKDVPHTLAGVWGITRELIWTDFKTAFPLTDITASKKSNVGVLGQSVFSIGVWGESRNDYGVVGTTGGPRGRNIFPDADVAVYGNAFYSDTTAMDLYGGYFESDSGNGILGRSKSEKTTKAGVVAWGTSTDDKAAALEIHDGAITVSGTARPAGKETIMIPGWMPITTMANGCPAPACVHDHIQGYVVALSIANPLVDLDRSIIQLTVEHPVHPVIASIETIVEGGFTFKVVLPVGSVFQAALPTEITVHYLIINNES